MKLIESSADSEYMAQKVNDTNGCYVVPAFTGLGAPYWDQYARGTILGLTRGVNKYHVIRATLESITYQVDDVLKAMEADSGMKLSALRVDGGASANNFLMQCQADISQAPVERPCCIETTAMGAVILRDSSTSIPYLLLTPNSPIPQTNLLITLPLLLIHHPFIPPSTNLLLLSPTPPQNFHLPILKTTSLNQNYPYQTNNKPPLNP